MDIPQGADLHQAVGSNRADPALRNSGRTCLSPLTLDRLYRREWSGVLGYLQRKVGPDLAWDLAQEVFVRAATSTHLTNLEYPACFLRRIARNLVIDHQRRSHRCRVMQALLEHQTEACPARQEDGIHARDTEQRMNRAFAELSPKTRLVFAMSRFEEMSYREIQRELGVALATVDYHMMKALSHLRGACAEPPEI